jgi:hypothetical protein
MDTETKDKPVVAATQDDAAKAVDSKMRELLVSQLTRAIGDREHLFNGVTVGIKFTDGNASFSGSGSHENLLELIDAHMMDVSVSLMEQLAMAGLTDSRAFAEALSRVEAVLLYGRVPQDVVIGRLMAGAENTKGKLSVATLDAGKIAALGCGDPHCENCGGDGSKLSASQDGDTTKEAPPSKRMLH